MHMPTALVLSELRELIMSLCGKMGRSIVANNKTENRKQCSDIEKHFVPVVSDNVGFINLWPFMSFCHLNTNEIRYEQQSMATARNISVLNKLEKK